jgi:hypothetical protein
MLIQREPYPLSIFFKNDNSIMKNYGKKVFFLIILSQACFSCLDIPQDCGNTAKEEFLNPSNTLKCVVFYRDCGATTDFALCAAILEKSQNLEINSPSFFSSDIDSGSVINRNNLLTVKWLDDKNLKIDFDNTLRIFKQDTIAKGIKITFEEN